MRERCQATELRLKKFDWGESEWERRGEKVRPASGAKSCRREERDKDRQNDRQRSRK